VGGGLDWGQYGRDWPLKEASRFIAAAGLDWHVQMLGEGPVVLLLHGTGASSHSWRDVAPVLATQFTVVSPDLPGHAFTKGRPARGLSLPAMAGAVTALLAALDVSPALVIGHSAGAAIAARMALDRGHAAPILGFAPALRPHGGLAAPLFSGIAKLLLVNPLAPRLFARVARVPGETGRFLLRSTGSRLDQRGVDLYALLFAASGHCAGALEMMARWDLAPMTSGLPRLPVPLHVVHGDADRAIPIAVAREAAALARGGFEALPGLGHLAHEERPELAAEIAQRFFAEHGRGG
jgi:magnesium chelatase accessory protein